MIKIETPISARIINKLKVGDQIEIYGPVFCGRDAVLPRLVELIRQNRLASVNVQLEGAVIFHTAVSRAGIGPTTSNKVEIEESIADLSRAGVRIHLGKGSLGPDSVQALKQHRSIFAVTPPASALFFDRTLASKVVAFEEEGMEALFEIQVSGLPAIVAIAHGKNIFRRLMKF
ncbi:MAG: fumarate hydratase C-terminal domain-containing protein [Desulfobacterales bacterium]|nr:MAG: fumarate hydratase C-terminal domain-containing protein [Desulfobacterales bacterium]